MFDRFSHVPKLVSYPTGPGASSDSNWFASVVIAQQYVCLTQCVEEWMGFAGKSARIGGGYYISGKIYIVRFSRQLL